jgi:hypothetical protein
MCKTASIRVPQREKTFVQVALQAHEGLAPDRNLVPIVLPAEKGKRLSPILQGIAAEYSAASVSTLRTLWSEDRPGLYTPVYKKSGLIL